MMTTTSPETVQIAGAGPAGLSAAICLARAGRAVIVHEAQAQVGARWSGGWQVIENFTRQDDVWDAFQRYGITLRCPRLPVHALTLFDDRMRATEVHSREPLGYLVRRGTADGTLDTALLAAAQEAGVLLRYRSRVSPREAVAVRATGPAAADGLGCEISFATTLRNRLQVILDPTLTPDGYAYLFVHEGWATIGMAILHDFTVMDRAWHATVERFQQLEPFTTGAARRSVVPVNFCLPRTLHARGALLAGEAAGLQDYLFGFGMRAAITSGCLAAQTILTADDYDVAWRRLLGPAHAASVALRYFYERSGRTGARWLIRAAGKARNVRAYLHGLYQPAWWQQVLLPLARWQWGHPAQCTHLPAVHWCRPHA